VQAGFVTYLLNSHWAEKEVRKIAIEGTRTRVSLTEYKQIKLPKPPMEEQVKIASMLSSIDDMIQIKQKRVFHKKSLKKSLMQDLLTGKVRVTVN
jgi:type I restriction enzyme S subunit